MENTPQPMPGAGAIISDTWNLFISTWKTSFKTSSLFIYIGLAYFVGGALAAFNVALTPIMFILSLGAGLLSAWISIRVILTMLKLEAGQQPMEPAEESKRAWSVFLSLIWVGFLTGLIVFGASLLFILPGIYFSVALYFSQIILIDQNIRGTQALAASRALVRGRWWATFWRFLAGGFVFGLLAAIIIIVASLIAGKIGGPNLITKMDQEDPFVLGVMQFIQMVFMAAYMPLLVGFQVKLYRILQKTR